MLAVPTIPAPLVMRDGAPMVLPAMLRRASDWLIVGLNKAMRSSAVVACGKTSSDMFGDDMFEGDMFEGIDMLPDVATLVFI